MMYNKWLIILLGISGLVFTSPHVLGQGKRVALVIGNTDYTVNDFDLRNPVNDATALARKLAGVGFEVMLRANATHNTMQKALTEFANQLGDNTVGLFYFSGHGMQGYDGQNYLLPADFRNPWAADNDADFMLQKETLGLNTVLQKMQDANNTLNIVILDACRDNPLAASGLSSGNGQRSIQRGLANINLLGSGDDEIVPSGTLIAYATSPNKTAEDGIGQHSPYTEALLNYIDEPGLPIEVLFKRVRRHVKQTTNDRQIPWETSSLEDSFYFSNRRRTMPNSIGGF